MAQQTKHKKDGEREIVIILGERASSRGIVGSVT